MTEPFNLFLFVKQLYKEKGSNSKQSAEKERSVGRVHYRPIELDPAAEMCLTRIRDALVTH